MIDRFFCSSNHILIAFALCVCLFANARFATSQPPTSSLASQYQQARTAYANKDFVRAAELFQGVANRCQGSELAIQCEYFAAISAWANEPCEASASKLNNWLQRAEKFQKDAVQSGRTFDDKLLAQWTDTTTLIHAKWDRQKNRFNEAEARLRSYLKSPSPDTAAIKDSPEGWLELGSILLQQRRDYTSAKHCFENALTCCHGAKRVTCHATWGCALSCWYNQQWDEALEFLNKLDEMELDDDIAIQSKVLQIKIAQRLEQAIDAAKILDPLVQLALAGNPEVATLYELALALIDAGLNAKSDEVLFQLVQRFPGSPIAVEARVRLARSSTINRKWDEAIRWSDEAIKGGCSNDLMPHVRLIRGQAELELGQLNEAKADLEMVLAPNAEVESPVELQVSVRFYLAETLYQLEKWKEAEQHWQWLLQAAQSTRDIASNQDWLPVVLLRTAEMLAMKKEWGQAEEIVLRIRNDFPKCNRSCEVDYLLARCLVSKAEFDAARQVLRSLTQPGESVPRELLARAHWMAGETFLMQRRFEEARQAYQQVLSIPDQRYWQSASLFQIGQCCEAMQNSQGAREAYEQIESQFADSPFTAMAQERRLLLPSLSAAKQSEQNSLGTKR